MIVHTHFFLIRLKFHISSNSFFERKSVCMKIQNIFLDFLNYKKQNDKSSLNLTRTKYLEFDDR
jgi:hypothetical protein